MDTILPSLANNAASLGLSGPDASNLTAAAGSTAAASSPTRGDTVTFSAEALAKASAMVSNAATASNAGVAQGGAEAAKAQKKSEDDGNATLQALKAQIERIQTEIKATEEGDAPREEREAKLAELRMSLLEAQTAYYKAKQQAGNDQGGSASQTAAAMAGLA
jgi:hypothetical protein